MRLTLPYFLLFQLWFGASRLDQWMHLPPVSVHQWRQADGAALAWNYAQQPDFTEAQICNLFYTGDAHALGELPVLYWLGGCISRFSDAPAWPLRWIGLALLFASGWAFAWLLWQLSGSRAAAIAGAGLLLSSPLLCYYGPSSLPDAPAFCFLLLMAAALFRAIQSGRPAWLYVSAFCAAMAILLKISMAILPLALLLVWLEGKLRQRWTKGSILYNKHIFLALLLTAGLVAAGRYWIDDFNTRHHAIYFLAGTRPVWNYDAAFILESIRMASRTGLPSFASAGLYAACVAALALLWNNRNAERKQVLYWSAAGCLAYMALWFRMLREHDYYLICLLILPAMLLAFGLPLAVRRFSEKKLLLALGICLVAGLLHDHWLMSRRLELAYHPATQENLPPDAFLPAYALTQAGIPASARVLCPQDPSPNIALLALGRQGWTAYNFARRITPDTLQKYQSEFDLRYLALRDTSWYKKPYNQFFPEKILETKGWVIYRK